MYHVFRKHSCILLSKAKEKNVCVCVCVCVTEREKEKQEERRREEYDKEKVVKSFWRIWTRIYGDFLYNSCNFL